MLKHLRLLVPVCLLLTPLAQGREAIRLAMHKLPIKTRFVLRQEEA